MAENASPQRSPLKFMTSNIHSKQPPPDTLRRSGANADVEPKSATARDAIEDVEDMWDNVPV
ncbi:MAG: hypothetical protein LJE62_13250 [Silicimonas sp.]|jgi:hypothetical protein|nr:hypothetical protein [Silicimonas sp.]